MTSWPLTFLFTDRRFWLFALTTMLAVFLGCVAIPNQVALNFVARFGFWFVLAAFVIFCRALWQTFSSEISRWRMRTVDWGSVVVVAIGGSVLLVHETFGFKILSDELMLLGTAMSMHLDKTALTPMRGGDIQGAFIILDGILDKRPLFFPFLVSLLHDLTGYRPANAFVLNGGLIFVFLGLVNALGRRLAGRLAGWLSVTLFAGLPLLAHNATGGGFELLNLVMILATLLLGVRYLERRDASAFTAFIFSALLMAQVRYESVVFFLPICLIVLWVWRRDGRAELPWPVMIGPLLMVHYLLHHRVFEMRAASWEMFSKPGYSSPFDAAYVPENLAHALRFFFAHSSDQPNALVLSTLGALAVPFFVLLVMKRLRRLDAESPVVVTTTFFALGFAAHFILLMCYFWGKFDDPVIRRLSLPAHLGMVIAIVAVLPQFANIWVPRVLLGVASVGLLALGVPSMAAHAYSQEYLPGRETAWRRQFIAEQPRHDYLVIDNDSVLWITHQVSGTPILQAIKRRESVIFHLRNRTYAAIYVFQRFNIDAATGKMTLREGDDLGPDYVLETVREERLQTLTLSRISRVKEIKSGPTVLTTPDPATHEVPKDRAAMEQARQRYLENFIKQLP